MHKSEKLAKAELIKRGYKVWRRGNKGLPDFQCWDKNKTFYVEVKSSNDGLQFNQLQAITQLLLEGEKVYLFYYNKHKNSFVSFEVTTLLEPIINFDGIPKWEPKKKTNKMSDIKCDICGKKMEGYTENQLNHMLEQHKLVHKFGKEKIVEKVKKKEI